MTSSPYGPGTRLLIDHLHLNDPQASLRQRHPAGDRGHRLARALEQIAAELDDAYREAQRAGEQLRAHRTSAALGPGSPHAEPTLGEAARRLEMAVQCCELTDTALVRLLASYLDLVAAPGSTLGQTGAMAS